MKPRYTIALTTTKAKMDRNGRCTAGRRKVTEGVINEKGQRLHFEQCALRGEGPVLSSSLRRHRSHRSRIRSALWSLGSLQADDHATSVTRFGALNN